MNSNQHVLGNRESFFGFVSLFYLFATLAFIPTHLNGIVSTGHRLLRDTLWFHSFINVQILNVFKCHVTDLKENIDVCCLYLLCCVCSS